jgi:hypothetical protein
VASKTTFREPSPSSSSGNSREVAWNRRWIKIKKSPGIRIFVKMIDVMSKISDRHLCFKFVCVRDPRLFVNYQQDFSIESLNCLMEILGRCFDLMLVKSDLVVVCFNVERHKKVNQLTNV